MADARWHFREMARGELNQDPMERELFADEPINERLVREAIQNSLDASLTRVGASTGGPVRVRFSLQGIRNPLAPTAAAPYLHGLTDHLVAGLDPTDDLRRRIADRGLAGEQMQYLVIEDAGTVGLGGDWRQYDDSGEESAQDNHFYWFFRNVGRSGKSDADSGSWGLGKWVFPDASLASAFIAVTRRHSDGETLLMGQSVLKKHNVGGRRYAPHGYFGAVDDHELALPFCMSEPAHQPLVQQCIDDFGLRFRDEPGLSVIIPFPRVEGDLPLDGPRMSAAIVHNYFYPILAGRLEVTVDEGGDSAPTRITTDTIDDVLGHLELEDTGERSEGSYRRLFEMCREAATWPDDSYIDLPSPPPRNVSNYKHHAKVAALRSQYDQRDLLAFRVTSRVQKKDGAKQPTVFRLFIEHDDSLTQGHDFYVRGDLSVSAMDEIKRYRARTLLIVDEEEPLAAMLRDSEPPSHTLWRPQSDRVTKRWVSPKRRIDAVRYAPRALLSIWESAPVEVQRDALADIFPSGGRGGRRRQDRQGETSRRAGGDPSPDPLSSHRDFAISKNGLGFRVRIAAGVESPPNRALLRVAYDTPGGDPTKSYSPHDFRLHGPGALDVQAESCQVNEGASGNEVLLDINDPHRFFVTVQGFDQVRDVHVRVERLADSQQAEGSDR